MSSDVTTDLRETLEHTLCDVLERQAMMFAEPVPAEEAELDDDALHARIRFSGPQSGHFDLVAGSDACRELAANMLGTEPDAETAKEDAADCLQELLNVLAGQVLTTAFGTGPVFHLSIPESKPVPEALRDELAGDPTACWVLADDLPMAARAACAEDPS